MKRLCLLLTTLMLSACGGGNSSSTSVGDGKQNFIYDASGNLIDGKVSLILVDMEKWEKAYNQYDSRTDLSDDEKIAYYYDLMKMNSTELCNIVYDTEKTGSFTYTFNVDKVLGSYMVNDQTLDVTKAKLYLNFVPSKANSEIKKAKLSNFTMKARIEYQLNTGKGIKNISREKSGSAYILGDNFVKKSYAFRKSFMISNFASSIMEVDEYYKAIDGDATLTFSGGLTASY